MIQSMIHAMNCPQCGANVSHSMASEKAGLHSISCAYCGSVLSIASTNNRQSTVRKDRAKRHRCPRCHDKLQRSRIRRGHVSACRRCGGLWIPMNILERLNKSGKKTRRTIAKLNRRQSHRVSTLPTNRHQAIACPECLELMPAQIYQDSSTVVVDVCEDHGIWFDEHEMLEAARQNRSSRRGRRYRSGWPSAARWQNSWDAFEHSHMDKYENFKWKRHWYRGWRYGPFFILLSVILAILEEIFD